MAATLSNVRLVASDMARAFAFYVDLLGLPVDKDRSAPPALLVVRAGACTLSIHDAATAGETPGGGPGLELGFEVLNLDEVSAKLAAAGYAKAPPQPTVWGSALAVRDPDGYHLNLFTTRAPSPT